MNAYSRHFEFKDEKSSKFWEITQADESVTVRYGKSSTAGQSQTKAFADAASASKHAQKLIAEKLGKGYVEQGMTTVAPADTVNDPAVKQPAAPKPKKSDAKANPVKPAKLKNLAQDPDAPPESLMALLDKDDATNRLLARHPRASTELLEKLSHSSDMAARKAVCLNPNSSKDVLIRLAPQFPGDFFLNPAFDWLLLEDPDLLFKLGKGVLKNILKRTDCPVSFMLWAAERGSDQEKLAVAMNNEATEEILRRFVDQGGAIAEAASCHQKLQTATDKIDLEESLKNGVAQAIASVGQSDVGGLSGKGLSAAQWPALTPINRLDKLEAGPTSIALMLLAEGRGQRWIESQTGRRWFASESVAPEFYSAMAKDADTAVRRSLLGNPSVSDAIKLSILWEMANDASAEVRAIVPQHKLTPPELLVRLADDEEDDVIYRIVENQNTPTDTRAKILSTYAVSKDFRWKAASDGSCPAKLLESLAQDKDSDVRSRVAGNPGCPPHVLEALVADKKVEVRAGVASNPACPTACFHVLADDLSRQTYGPSVQEAVAENPACPSSVLERLALSKLSDIRKRVAKNANGSLETLQLLVADVDVSVRENLAGNVSVSEETIRYLAKDTQSRVRVRIGRRAELPPQVFEMLAVDKERWVRSTAAGNSGCPERVLALLAKDEDPEVRFEVTKNVACPPPLRASVLSELALTWTDSYHYGDIMANALISKEDLAKLSRHKLAGVRQAIAARPDCPQECLMRLANDKSPSVVDSVAGNPSCPVEVLRHFIEKGTALLSVAGNSECPADALPLLWEKLLESDYCRTIDAVHETLFSKHEDKRNFKIPESFIGLIKRECQVFLESPLNTIAWKQIQAACKDEATKRACIAGDLLFIAEEFAEGACNSKELAVRLLGLSHRKASPAVLAKCSKSVHWVERMVIARNPNTPPNIIDSLCKDSNLFVAQQARQTIGVKAATTQRQSEVIQSSDSTVDLSPVVAEIRKRLATASDLSNSLARDAFCELCNSQWNTSFPLKYWLYWGAKGRLSPLSVDQGLRLGAKLLTPLEMELTYASQGDVAKLAQLADSSDKEVRRLVASSTEASFETLTQLAKDRSPEVRECVIKNTKTPESVLLNFAKSKDKSVRRTLAQYATLASVLGILAGDSDPWVVETVASNRCITDELFRKLAATKKESLPYLAGNPVAPHDLLRLWATKASDDVRLAVAENVATPPEILSVLVEDKSVEVLTRLCTDVRLQPEQRASVIRRLAARKSSNDEDPHCFAVAQCVDLPIDLIDAVLEACSKAARDRHGLYLFQQVAERSTQQTVLERLAVNPDSTIRATVADNENTPENVLGMLATDADQAIRCAVAKNVHAPLHSLKRLAAESNSEIRCAVAGNTASPMEVLAQLEGDTEFSVRMALASNPNAPVEVLEKLSKNANEGLRERVSSNPAAPIELRISLLEGLLNQYRSEPVEYLGVSIVKNDAVTPAMLDALLAITPSGLMLMRVYGHKIATASQLSAWVASSKAHPVLRLIACCNPNYPDVDREEAIEALVNHIVEVADQPLDPLVDITSSEIVLALKALRVFPGETDKKAIAAAAKSRDWLERVASTLSPATQLSLLKMLVEDETLVVKQLAIDRIKSLESLR